MLNSFHKIDEGLYICGANALRDQERLHHLGIRCILNAAERNLYKRDLETLCDRFEVKIIGAEDSPEFDMSAHFEDIANFVEAGRAQGGVVVHCSAGVSRACTSVMSYLMIKQAYDVKSAFRLVQCRRKFVSPNVGFFEQLLALQDELRRGRGMELTSLPDDWVPPDIEQPQDTAEGFWEFSDKYDDLTRDVKMWKDMGSNHCIQKYLTACVLPKQGIAPEDLAAAIRQYELQGVSWETVSAGVAEVQLRACLSFSWTALSLRNALLHIDGVEFVEVESE